MHKQIQLYSLFKLWQTVMVYLFLTLNISHTFESKTERKYHSFSALAKPGCYKSLCMSICAHCDSSMDGHLHLLHIFTFNAKCYL